MNPFPWDEHERAMMLKSKGFRTQHVMCNQHRSVKCKLCSSCPKLHVGPTKREISMAQILRERGDVDGAEKEEANRLGVDPR